MSSIVTPVSVLVCVFFSRPFSPPPPFKSNTEMVSLGPTETKSKRLAKISKVIKMIQSHSMTRSLDNQTRHDSLTVLSVIRYRWTMCCHGNTVFCMFGLWFPARGVTGSAMGSRTVNHDCIVSLAL